MAIEDIGGEIYQLKVGVDEKYSVQKIRSLLKQAQQEMSGSKNTLKLQIQPDAKSLKDIKNLNPNKLTPSTPITYDFGLESQKDLLNDLINTARKDAPNAFKNMGRQINTILTSSTGKTIGMASEGNLKSYANALLGGSLKNLTKGKIDATLSKISQIANSDFNYTNANFSQMMKRITDIANAQGFMRELKDHKTHSGMYSNDLLEQLNVKRVNAIEGTSRQIISRGGKLQASITNAIVSQENTIKKAIEDHVYRLQMTLSELEGAALKSTERISKINANILSASKRANLYRSTVERYKEVGEIGTSNFWKSASKSGYDKLAMGWARKVKEIERTNPEALYDANGNYSVKVPKAGLPKVEKAEVVRAGYDSLREYLESSIMERYELKEFMQGIKKTVRSGYPISKEDASLYKQLANLPGLKKGEYIPINKIKSYNALKLSQEQLLSAYNEAIDFRKSGQEIPRNRQFGLKYGTLDSRYKINGFRNAYDLQDAQPISHYALSSKMYKPKKLTGFLKSKQSSAQGGAVLEEANSLSNLEAKLASVTKAIDAKTKAFQNEGTIVSQTVSEEIVSLSQLESKVEQIASKTQNLSNGLKGVNEAAAGLTSSTEAINKADEQKTKRQKDGSQKSNAKSKEALSVYNKSDLDKTGQLYLSRLYNNKPEDEINKIIASKVKQWGKNNGIAFQSVDIQSIKDMDGNLRSFNITAKESANVIKKFALEKAKIKEGSGKNRTGFVLKDKKAITTTRKDENVVKQAKQLKEKPVSQKDIAGVKELTSAYKQLFNSIVKQGKSYAEVRDLITGKGGINEQKAFVYSQKGFNAEKFEKSISSDTQSSWKNYLSSLNTKANKLQLKLNSNEVTNIDLYKTKLNELKGIIQQIESMTFDGIMNGTEADIAKLNALQEKFATTYGGLKNGKEFKPINENFRTKTIRNMTKWLEDNTAASKETIANVERLRSSMYTVNNDADGSRIAGEFNRIANSAKAAGQAGDSMFTLWKRRLKTLVPYLLSYQSFYRVIAMFRQGINTIKEYNTVLTEMRKVSNESLDTLKKYQSETFDIGDAIGTSAKTIQKSTADWMRLGEAIDEAKKSAKATAVLYNVSEFENIDEASDGLVSISQAYKDIEKMDIVDKINYIGNNYAIATDGLTAAMQRSSAALLTQGNNIDEAIALMTAGNTVIQDPEKVGTAATTISLRIAGTEVAKEELESLGEDIEDYVVRTSSKTDDIIKKYTAVQSNNFKGVSVLDENGNLKNTYEILLAISKIYKEIQEEDKKQGTNRANALIEELGGKRQANIVASILSNPDILESVYEDSKENSTDSALKENEKELESIEAQFTRLKNSADEFWDKFIGSDIVKGVTKLLNFFVKGENFILSLTGAIPQIFSIIAAVKAYKGKGYFMIHSTNVKKALENLYCIG